MNDTITAISTALGVGAISIIRVSGNDAIKIVKKIFKGKDLEKMPSHSISYGHIIDKTILIDEVLVSIMKAPKTFTTEDTVEINCHGGIATTNKVLELLLENGCRLAEPGEFTKRAFLNGRIDLLEAESVMDLISAKTEKARTMAVTGISGSLSKLITDLRKEIIEILANIEVNIDYPEYEDIQELTIPLIKPKIQHLEKKLQDILNESKNGKIIKEGIKVAIIGRPNVGKSSLLNALLDEEKAIVTDIAGTTRDIIEGTVNINGIILNIIDTAGIRNTEDPVERLGVAKTKQVIKEADLILLMLNNNEELSDEDQEIITQIQTKKHIIIINKVDLSKKLQIDSDNIINMSIKNQTGIKELKQKIIALFNLGNLETKDFTYLSSSRSITLVKQALETINEVKKGIDNEIPIDMIEIDIKKIWQTLGSIIGETYEDELINQLFSQFCLGK